ncbi:MAG: DNA/RNA helicase domain-containing protein [Marmoricola sp.]
MTSFRIEEVAFERSNLDAWAALDPRFRNWPVVYALGSADKIYVGESLSAVTRLRQHLDDARKAELTGARIVVDATFNKSVCLDLESHLIRLFSGDGQYDVLNRNVGITDSDYYGRAEYRLLFDEIFEELRERGAFSRSVREIENSDLFKLSPFKALTQDQAIAMEDILDGLFQDLADDRPSQIVIQGDPGTGKTVVAIYLMKLLSDIKASDPAEAVDEDAVLSEFFLAGYPELLEDFRVGLVIPQQSLRKSIEKVFRRTPGLDAAMVLTPFEVGEDSEPYDLLIVDEAHRLNQRANQPSGVQNRRYADINERLFGSGDSLHTQLDWIVARSTHQIFLIDAAQSVRPADLPRHVVDQLLAAVDEQRRRYRLTTQMRVAGGDDYVGYVRRVLSADPPAPQTFDQYDLRLFDDFPAMVEAIRRKDDEHGLGRLVAGYAWPWRSKANRDAIDIDIDGVRLQWNRTAVDWVGSPTSRDEVGSIHTVQGYDLNYAGVIIGPDLRYDAAAGRLVFDRDNYFDSKGKENNPRLGIVYSDDDLLQLVTNIYAVLVTRGILGTYLYVCDEQLRSYLSRYLPRQKAVAR